MPLEALAVQGLETLINFMLSNPLATPKPSNGVHRQQSWQQNRISTQAYLGFHKRHPGHSRPAAALGGWGHA